MTNVSKPSYEPEFFEQGRLVAVLTTQPLDRFLDYRAPEGGVLTGALVVVPLGPRKVFGVVWGPGEGSFDPSKIRAIDRLIDLPPMTPSMRACLEKVAAYTLSPLEGVLRMAMRMPGLTQRTGLSADRGLRRSTGFPVRAGRARRRIHIRGQRAGRARRADRRTSPSRCPFPAP